MMTHYSYARYPGLSIGVIDGKPPSAATLKAIGEVYERLLEDSMKRTLEAITHGKTDRGGETRAP